MLPPASPWCSSRSTPYSWFFKLSQSLQRTCAHHAELSPRARWRCVSRMAEETRCREFKGAMRVSIRARACSHAYTARLMILELRQALLRAPPLSGQLHVRLLSSRRRSSACPKWLQVQQSTSTESAKPVRAGHDDCIVFRTETDGWSTIFEIEGAVKELCEEIVVEGTTTLKP